MGCDFQGILRPHRQGREASLQAPIKDELAINLQGQAENMSTLNGPCALFVGKLPNLLRTDGHMDSYGDIRGV
jgi:hypothetical protein